MEKIEGVDMPTEVRKIFTHEEWKKDVPEGVQKKVLHEFTMYFNMSVC